MEAIVKELCEQHGIFLELKKNMSLVTADTKNQNPCVYYLVEGICALMGYSASGQENVFLYHMPGRMVGVNPYLSGIGTKQFSYNGPRLMTRTKCCLYRIPVSAFKHYLNTNLEFNHYMVHLLSENYHHTLAHFKQLQEESCVTVVCRFLISMCMETDNGLVLPRFFTHDEIAKYLGVHMVTVSRIISKLQKSGYLLRVPSGLFIQNLSALESIVENCETFQY